MNAPPIKSAERALTLLELFALEQVPMTVTELARGMDIPQSSTSALIQSLVTMGYLEQDIRSRTYYPTIRVTMLGTWMRRAQKRAGQLPELLSEASKITGESTVLAMRNGIYSQYILGYIGKSPDRARVESGMLYPLACSSTGWCLLSSYSDVEIGKIIRRTRVEAKREHWRTTAASALDQVRSFRTKGYVFSSGETVPGLGGYAILLPSQLGASALSAGVGGPIERLKDKKTLILDTLDQLSKGAVELVQPSP